MADTVASRQNAAAMRAAAKWIYWIVGFVVISAISYFFYNNLNKQVAAVLFFIIGVAGLYFYYVKWFIVPERRPIWPPYVTPCPDYLTQITNPTAAGSKYKCVDFVGVSRNGALKRASKDQLPAQQNNPNYFVEIDPAGLKRNSNAMGDLRSLTISKGLTWSTLFGNN
jgi:hypothetical protein